ncbi:hypothetical protein I317_05453 [Kwoniella heveanensis CBS 569]|nr:hypothetical protein I317_05453 [Kwoniella heveanensis CBS 569]
MSVTSVLDLKLFDEDADLPGLDDDRDEAILVENGDELLYDDDDQDYEGENEEQADDKEYSDVHDGEYEYEDDDEENDIEYYQDAQEVDREEPLVSVTALGVDDLESVRHPSAGRNAPERQENPKPILSEDLEIPPENIWVGTGSAMDGIRALYEGDRRWQEEQLRTWLSEKYPLSSAQAKAVAASSIPFVRRHIAQSSPHAKLENGRITLSNRTSFARTLLSDIPVPGIEDLVGGDEMLLAIALDRNQKLVPVFGAMVTSSEDDPLLDRSAVRQALQQINKRQPAVIYALDFGWDKLYIGLTEVVHKRLPEHKRSNVNSFFAPAKDLLRQAGREIEMSTLVSWPSNHVPRLALFGLETIFIACIGTNSGPLQMQRHSLGALPSPPVELSLIRPTWLRYVAKAREAAAANQFLPPITCFLRYSARGSQKLHDRFKEELATSSDYYSELFHDVIARSGLDASLFLSLVFGSLTHGFKKDRIRRAILSLEELGYRREPLAHARVQNPVRRKFKFDADTDRLGARNRKMTKEFGRSLAYRTFQDFSQDMFTPGTQARLRAKYGRLFHEYEAAFPRGES